MLTGVEVLGAGAGAVEVLDTGAGAVEVLDTGAGAVEVLDAGTGAVEVLDGGPVVGDGRTVVGESDIVGSGGPFAREFPPEPVAALTA